MLPHLPVSHDNWQTMLPTLESQALCLISYLQSKLPSSQLKKMGSALANNAPYTCRPSSLPHQLLSKVGCHLPSWKMTSASTLARFPWQSTNNAPDTWGPSSPCKQSSQHFGKLISHLNSIRTPKTWICLNKKKTIHQLIQQSNQKPNIFILPYPSS